MEGQDEFIIIMRNSDNVDVGSGEDYEEALADVGCKTDLYVVNQASTDLLREAHTGDSSFALHRSRPILLLLLLCLCCPHPQCVAALARSRSL